MLASSRVYLKRKAGRFGTLPSSSASSSSNFSRRRVDPAFVAVDQQHEETAAGVVLQEGLGEHPGVRDVVLRNDGAGVERGRGGGRHEGVLVTRSSKTLAVWRQERPATRTSPSSRSRSRSAGEAEELLERVGERRGVAGIGQPGGAAGGLRQGRGVRGQHRRAAGHRLDHRQAVTFGQRRIGEKGGAIVEGGQRLPRHLARGAGRSRQPAAAAESGRQPVVVPARRARQHQRKGAAQPLLGQGGMRRQQGADVLARLEAAHRQQVGRRARGPSGASSPGDLLRRQLAGNRAREPAATPEGVRRQAEPSSSPSSAAPACEIASSSPPAASARDQARPGSAAYSARCGSGARRGR